MAEVKITGAYDPFPFLAGVIQLILTTPEGREALHRVLGDYVTQEQLEEKGKQLEEPTPPAH